MGYDIEKIKADAQHRQEQRKLKEKYNIPDENVIIKEKSHILKFLIKTGIALVKAVASMVVIGLCTIGILTLVYPETREPFFGIISQLLEQLHILL